MEAPADVAELIRKIRFLRNQRRIREEQAERYPQQLAGGEAVTEPEGFWEHAAAPLVGAAAQLKKSPPSLLMMRSWAPNDSDKAIATGAAQGVAEGLASIPAVAGDLLDHQRKAPMVGLQNAKNAIETFLRQGVSIDSAKQIWLDNAKRSIPDFTATTAVHEFLDNVGREAMQKLGAPEDRDLAALRKTVAFGGDVATPIPTIGKLSEMKGLQEGLEQTTKKGAEIVESAGTAREAKQFLKSYPDYPRDLRPTIFRQGTEQAESIEEMIRRIRRGGVDLTDDQVTQARHGEKPKLSAEQVAAAQARRRDGRGIEQQIDSSIPVRSASFPTKAKAHLLEDIPIALERSGPAGEYAAKTIRSIERQHRQAVSPAVHRIDQTLGKLGDDELELFQEAMRGKIPTDQLPDLIRSLVRVERANLKKMAERMEAAGVEIQLPNGRKVPFHEIENYYPQWSELADESGQIRSLRPKSGTLSPATKARTADDAPFDRRLDVLKSYYDLTTRQLLEHELLGRNVDGWIDEVSDVARRTGEDAEFIRDNLKISFGGYPKADTFTQKMAETVTNASVTLAMPFAWIAQPTQNLLTMARVGLPNFGRAVADFATKEGRDLAKGIYVDSGAPASMRSGFIEETGNWLERMARRTTKPNEILDTMNRKIASNAGAHHARDLAKFIATGKRPVTLRSASGGVEEARAELEKLIGRRIDPEELRSSGGELVREDLLNASYEISERTQFPMGSHHVGSFWARSPLARTVFLLQRFGVKAMEFAIEEALVPALKQKKIAPLLTLLGGSQIIARYPDAVRDFLYRREPRESDWLRSSLRNLTEIGVAGIVANMYYSTLYDKVPSVSVDKSQAILGAFGKDLIEILHAGADAGAEGDLGPVKDYLEEHSSGDQVPVLDHTARTLVREYPPAKAAAAWLED